MAADNAYVCIRPLDIPGVPDQLESLAVVHCYVMGAKSAREKKPSWSSAFDKKGVHTELSPAHFWRVCVPLQGATVAKLKSAQSALIRTGDYEAADYDLDEHNCCHYVDSLIRRAGSPRGVEGYFPLYDLPGN